MAGGGGGSDTPSIGQSLSYISLQQVVVESVVPTIATSVSSPAPTFTDVSIQISTKSGSRNWQYVTPGSSYTSTADDVAGMVGDLRFIATVFAQGGSDRVLYLNDVFMACKFASISDGTIRLAQSFTTGGSSYGVGGVDVILKKLGTIGDIIVEIQTDSSNSPSGTVVSGTSVTVPAANVPTSLGWVTANFGSAPTLSASTKYWIVVRSASAFGTGNFLMWRAKTGNPYSTGNMMYYSGSTWTAQSTVDNLFRLKKGTGGTFAVNVAAGYKARWQ